MDLEAYAYFRSSPSWPFVPQQGNILLINLTDSLLCCSTSETAFQGPISKSYFPLAFLLKDPEVDRPRITHHFVPNCKGLDSTRTTKDIAKWEIWAPPNKDFSYGTRYTIKEIGREDLLPQYAHALFRRESQRALLGPSVAHDSRDKC